LESSVTRSALHAIPANINLMANMLLIFYFIRKEDFTAV